MLNGLKGICSIAQVSGLDLYREVRAGCVGTDDGRWVEEIGRV